MDIEKHRKAIVLGATGAVGGHILKALLHSSDFYGITTLGRRPVPDIQNEQGKLTQYAVDVFNPATYAPYLAGHSHAFCAFGIGQPSKTNPGEFQRVDIDAVFDFAAACHGSGVQHFSVMTSVGADPGSSVRYLRLKGILEQKITALGFLRTSFFRPSMLITPVNRYGLLQGILLKVLPVLDPLLLGSWKRYRSITVAELGTAMVLNAQRSAQGVEILEWENFKRIGQR